MRLALEITKIKKDVPLFKEQKPILRVDPVLWSDKGMNKPNGSSTVKRQESDRIHLGYCVHTGFSQIDKIGNNGNIGIKGFTT